MDCPTCVIVQATRARTGLGYVCATHGDQDVPHDLDH